VILVDGECLGVRLFMKQAFGFFKAMPGLDLGGRWGPFRKNDRALARCT
jgi:hypothetical protein